MATIGIYDSGIGGLTTLTYLLPYLGGNDVYYLADNLNLPFGNKKVVELEQIVKAGIDKLRKHCDKIVVACNTASCIAKDCDLIRLLPPLHNVKKLVYGVTNGCVYSSDVTTICNVDITKAKTLLLATPRTISTLKAYGMLQSGKIVTTSTSELASLIEANANLSLKKGYLDMSGLLPYLENKLNEFKGVEKVILGCSHYAYVKEEIKQILGKVTFVDGNQIVKTNLLKTITLQAKNDITISFDFTGQNEGVKYRTILKQLLQNLQ